MKSATWVRPVVLAVSCLVLGFVGGWSLASIGGDEISLPEANVDVTVQEPAPGTTTVTPSVEEPPERGEVTVQVVNGVGTTGLAASTATRLGEAGYDDVSTGNITPVTGPTTVYYRVGMKAAAERLATDLQVTEVAPIAGSPVANTASSQAELVVLLGPG